ncbi:SMC-Scp complex subunit ScpB [candidate division KSB1 bacterium]|nr:SMC-Scp complex subunit ScpB [candidate division KSB1 bacterium]RQW01105.1 MAG: SMC-Scp complex subunit ScpB [candidate division KSB1 bacterium]
MDSEQLKCILEALVFASDSPLKISQMAAILKDVDHSEIEAALTHLSSDLADRAIYLKKVGGGFQFGTRPEYAEWIGEMLQEKQKSRLSRAALEALAIVAFKQPISRVEVSALRGVNSEGVMKKLLDFRLITISGRDHGPGRALLFKTTPEFLNYFGINELSELPRPKEIEELLAEGEGVELLREIPEQDTIADADSDDESDKSNPDHKIVSSTTRTHHAAVENQQEAQQHDADQ